MKKAIIGHRGHPCKFHENTLDSFWSAIDNGVNFIEFDVRRTADNILVAFHDPFIPCNELKLPISSLTLKNLQEIAEKQHFSVPRIETIFSEFSKYCGFDIELKEPGCEMEVVSFLSKHGVYDSCFFTSFYDSILRTLKTIDKSIKTGYLFESPAQFSTIDVSIMDYLCPEQSLYTENETLFRNGSLSSKQIAVWTVDTLESMKRFFRDPAIFAVITNRCDLALQAYTL
jgi:glycerophosphoryl diester phosphodiesterase